MLVETVDPSMNGGSLPFWKFVRPKYAGLRCAEATHQACHLLLASSRAVTRSWALEGEGERKAAMLSSGEQLQLSLPSGVRELADP